MMRPALSGSDGWVASPETSEGCQSRRHSKVASEVRQRSGTRLREKFRVTPPVVSPTYRMLGLTLCGHSTHIASPGFSPPTSRTLVDNFSTTTPTEMSRICVPTTSYIRWEHSCESLRQVPRRSDTSTHPGRRGRRCGWFQWRRWRSLISREQLQMAHDETVGATKGCWPECRDDGRSSLAEPFLGFHDTTDHVRSGLSTCSGSEAIRRARGPASDNQRPW